MKMQYLIPIIFILLTPKTIHSQVYFPLHVGDSWGYSSYGLCENLVINTIDKDTLIAGKKYFHFTGGKTIYSALFVRTDSNKVFSFDTSMQREYPIFDFSAKAGDTISVVNRDSYIALGNMKFFHAIPLGLYEGYTFTLRDSIGVIEESSTLGPCILKLTSANIQGKQVVLTSVKNAVPERIGALELFVPYPNPFNPTTVISFQLSAVSQTTLVMYDVVGREITTLVNGMKEPGTHSVTWDASPFSSGIYFAQLHSGGRTLVKKMSLLK